MKKRKLMSLFLAFTLCFADLAPSYVFAAPEDEDATEAESEEDLPAEGEDQPEALAEVPTEDVDYSDVESLAYGSSSAPVDGIAYLPINVLSTMHEDELEAYVNFCDTGAELMQEYPDIEDYVIYTDERGNLCFSFEVSANAIDGAIFRAPGTELAEPDTDWEDEELPEDTDIYFPDESEADAAVGDLDVPAGYNLQLVDIPETVQFDEEDEIDLKAELEEEYGEMIEADGLFTDDMKNWFYNQLNSTAKTFYKAAYNGMVKGKSNSYSYSTKSYSFSWTPHINAISALWETYPTRFGWFSYAGSLHAHGQYNYGSRSYSYSITLPRSKYYSSSLNSKANKKVEELVKNAYAYAAQNYPNSPSFGIVRYFDQWICENNFYEYAGTDDSVKGRKSKVYFNCHRQYGILLMGYGVCESYALASTCLLDKAGIPNIYITGKTPGGYHAWNYVKMPTGQWYLLDTTWDDSGAYSDQGYFLIPNDSSHSPIGNNFTGGQQFSFPSTASSRYTNRTESFTLPTVAIKKGKKKLLEPSGTYAKMITSDWTSSDPSIVKVNKNGKVTAKKLGVSTISCRISNLSASCKVVVYQLTKLSFESNGKKSASDTLSLSSTGSYTILVDQKEKVLSASELINAGVAEPKISCSKKNVASVSYTVKGDQIILNVTPLKKGKTTVTVKFGGKTAKLTLKVG